MVFVRKLIWFFVGGCIIITILIAVWILYPNYHKILQTFTLNIFQEFIIDRASDTARSHGAVEKICEIHKNTHKKTQNLLEILPNTCQYNIFECSLFLV